MERPYLRSGKRGNERNYYDELKDYSGCKTLLE